MSPIHIDENGRKAKIKHSVGKPPLNEFGRLIYPHFWVTLQTVNLEQVTSWHYLQSGQYLECVVCIALGHCWFYTMSWKPSRQLTLWSLMIIFLRMADACTWLNECEGWTHRKTSLILNPDYLDLQDTSFISIFGNGSKIFQNMRMSLAWWGACILGCFVRTKVA